ncbi:MAG: HAMP domain-containing sensor histidine kinase [Thermodesulfobacteriota bacterium]
MKIRSIVVYWLFILVPTLAVAVAMVRLLTLERDRIVQQASSVALDRAKSIADALQVTVETVEANLGDALREIPPDRVLETLQGWQENNPLVRNVFIWRSGTGLVYPQRDRSGTVEEKQFVLRYHALFSGRQQWPGADGSSSETRSSASQDLPGRTAVPGLAPQQDSRQSFVQEMQRLQTGAQQLANLARPKIEKSGQRAVAAYASPDSGGWIPWFAENRLYILGWVGSRSTGWVYGLELEVVTLLSQLVAHFPATAPEGLAYALVDGQGQVVHQTGNPPQEKGRKPALGVSLSPQLPHWQVVVHTTGNRPGTESARAFLILGCMLVAIFVLAVGLGGSMLTRQAHRNMKDALQKTSFVSNVSHEFKTPLTTIRMYAELLSEGRIKDPEKGRHYLNVIAEESRRLTRMVNNVLDFSRLEQGRKTYRIEDLDLAECVRHILEVHRLRVQEAGMALETEIPDAAVCVRADRDAMDQVVLNLVDNAVKYAAAGAELRLILRQHGDHAEMRVSDRGPGIPASHRSRVFEKFHRVDDSLTAQQQGCGLGLNIARRIMGDLGGDVLYEPRDGGGSTFIVRVPIRASETCGPDRA